MHSAEHKRSLFAISWATEIITPAISNYIRWYKLTRQDMEEKARSNPFSISNILNNNRSRENGKKDSDDTSEAGGTLDRQRSDYTRKQGCEIYRPDASPSDLDRRMEYDFEDWSRTSVEG